MTLAKIIKAGRDDREFNIRHGDSSLGSALENTIVLLDEDVAPEHLTFHAEMHSLTVEVSEGAAVGIKRADMRTKDGVIVLVAGHKTECHEGDILLLGGIIISLSNVPIPAEKPALDVPDKKGAARAARKWATSICGGILVALALGFAVIEVSEPLEAAVKKQNTVITVPVQTATILPEAHVQPAVSSSFSDGTIAKAVKTEIEGMQYETKLISVKNGKVFLKNNDNLDAQDKIKKMIQNDIAGVKSVTFEQDQLNALSAIKTTVTGLWSGPFPYVVMQSGRTVRPGEKLTDDATLIAVDHNALIVNFDGHRKRVVFP